MQVPCGTWEGHPPKYKVWDLCMTLEPLLGLQARPDAYEAMLPVQAGSCVNACITAWLADSLMPAPKAALLNLLPKLCSCNHHKHKRGRHVAYTAIGPQCI